MIASGIEIDSFKSTQRAGDDLNSLAGAQETPGLRVQAGADNGLKRRHLAIVDWRGGPTHAHHVNYTRRGENGKPRTCLKATEYIAGEEGKLNFFDTIRPRPPAPVQRQERFVSLVAECFGDPPFALRPYSYREPAAGRTIRNHGERLRSKVG